MNIQWYPGHMTKTYRAIREDISLVDIVIELLDARIPYSSKNPDIDSLCGARPRLTLFNKADLADAALNARWEKIYSAGGSRVIQTNAATGMGVGQIAARAKELTAQKRERLKARGRAMVTTRAMIVGIPNVGKSTLINRLARKSAAKTADRPGVTRGKQWIRAGKDFELLDTPGILWPRFDDPAVGVRLALTGAIKDDILDTYTLALRLLEELTARGSDCFACLSKRYGICCQPGEKQPEELLGLLAAARGFLIKGAVPDTQRAAITLIDEFRAGKLGRITLEEPGSGDELC